MARMPALQNRLCQGWNIDRFGVEIVEGLLEFLEVTFVGENGEIQIAAELGGAVQNASLAAHEQEPDPPPLDRRKDFDDRAPAQAILPGLEMWPRVFAIQPNAAQASSTTIPALLDPVAARKRKVFFGTWATPPLLWRFSQIGQDGASPVSRHPLCPIFHFVFTFTEI